MDTLTNTMIANLQIDWKADLALLERKLEDARERHWKIAEFQEEIRQVERDIERLEGAEILQQTSPAGAINGSNESTRKKQTASLLETLKSQPGQIHDLYVSLESKRQALVGVERCRAEDLDATEIARLQLQHTNAVLRAMGG